MQPKTRRHGAARRAAAVSAAAAAAAVCAFFPPARADMAVTEVKTSEAVFSRPHDAAVTPEGNYLYAADSGHDEIKVLDPGALRVLLSFGAGELSSPRDAAFDRRGRVLIADTGNNRIAVYEVKIRKYSSEAALTESWDAGGALIAPSGAAAGPDGRVYASGAGSGNIIALENGGIAARAGDSGPAAQRLSRPHDVAVSPDGMVYAADSGNHRIVIYDRDLNWAGELSRDRYGFHEPKYLAFAEDGRLFIADEGNNRILVLAEDRSVIGEITGAESGGGVLRRPGGVDAAGRYVWAADTGAGNGSGRIRLFRIGGL